MDSLLAEVLFTKGWTIYQTKIKDKTPIKSNNISYNMLVIFKEICYDESAFKLKPQATDWLIRLVVRHYYVLKSFLITPTACRNGRNI